MKNTFSNIDLNTVESKHFFSNIEICDIDFTPIINKGKIFTVTSFNVYEKDNEKYDVKTFHCDFIANHKLVKLVEYSKIALNKKISEIFIDISSLV